jgi:signal transduction histidine kinase
MRRLDAGIALFVAAAVAVQVFAGNSQIGTPVDGPRWLTVPFIALVSVPLAWRRTRPLLVGCIVLGAIVVQGLVTGNTPEGIPFIVIWVLVPYGLAAYTERRESLIGLGLVLGSFAIYTVENDDVTSGRAGDVWSGAFFLVLAVGAWLAGMVVRNRRESAELAQAAEAARSDERSRMARELHDIVSHNLSVVVLQAAGARAQADGDEATLEKIERSGREALVEMRRLLGVLREDGDDGSPLAPQPGIAQLPELVERVRAAGVAVDLDLDPHAAGLEPALDLSAYRIVQEGLTNALKHAGPDARVTVDVHREQQRLTISIADDGAGRAPAAAPNGSGHGLAGMRERVALLGGELRAGPQPAGGFSVDASLPLGS